MRRMYSENQLIALIEQYGGKVTPEEIQEMFDDGEVNLFGQYVRIMDAPASTTLTDEEIEQIGEGTFINGQFLGYKNPIIYPFGKFGDNVGGIIIGKVGSTNDVDIAGYLINPSKQIGTFPVGQYNNLCLKNLKSVNGKDIPAYPSNTGTFTLKCVDDALTWVQDE